MNESQPEVFPLILASAGIIVNEGSDMISFARQFAGSLAHA